MRTIFFDISVHFAIYEDACVNVNSLFIKFLYNIFVPDVSSLAIPSFMFLSGIPSFDVIVVEDDAANKV